MFSFSTVRRKAGWVALLPQGDHIGVAHVVRDAGVRPEIRMLESFAAEQGEVEALERLRTSRQLKSYACTTLMGNGEYKISQIDAPNVPAAERKEAVRWGLKGLLDYPVENACVEVLEIPVEGAGAGRQPGIFAVSAAESAVLARVGPFEAAKISLAAVDISELAQRNVAALFEDENRGLAFLRLDKQGGMLTLTFHGELIAVRRVDIPTTQLVDGNVDRSVQAMERLVLELQRSLDNFDRQYSHIPISKLVVAAYPQPDNLVEVLGESLYVPVHAMDLAQVMDFPAQPELAEQQYQAMNFLLIGAALRDGEAAK